jgi:hypothetical protein
MKVTADISSFSNHYFCSFCNFYRRVPCPAHQFIIIVIIMITIIILSAKPSKQGVVRFQPHNLTDISEVLTVHIIRFLITEAVMTSETSVNLNETTRRNIPEDSHLQNIALLNILLSLFGFPHHSRHSGIVLCGKP